MTDYSKRKERERVRQADQSAEGRRLPPLHPPRDLERKNGALDDFRRFCLDYFPATFALPFSEDHLKVIARIEQAVTAGGLFALAMPRGSGKTTICECACLWSLLYGHRSFVVLVGADCAAAERSLDSIKTELETNERLWEDFPEVCVPVWGLERIANRAKGQLTAEGEPTYLTWGSDKVVLPTVPGSAASGSAVKAVGITSSFRGLKHKRPDGVSLRPDLVVIDDPQSDESAQSLTQCATRERILSGAVLGLAGPGKTISGIMPCTVIAPGDMADRILDRGKHPAWQGERMKLVYDWPERMDLWERYRDLRLDDLAAGGDGGKATEFYRAHRQEMDQGSRVAWPERYLPTELSALQHAMNLRWQSREGSEAAFLAEYQNEPLSLTPADAGELSVEQICARVNRHVRGTAPAGCTRLTAFVDVQQDLLYWVTAAWEEDFTGHVVAYGAWPDQQRDWFALSQARPTIQAATKVSSIEGALWEALSRLAGELCGREWPQEGGGGLRIERLLVDSGWQTDLVYRWCRQGGYASVAVPSKGVAIGAAGRPVSEWPKKPGERRGPEWLQRAAEGTSGSGRTRLVIYDANWWKSWLFARLGQPPGERGALSLYGDDSRAHRMLAEHLRSEYRVRTEGRGRQVDEWRQKPDRPDNHLLDCTVGAAVAASMLGCTLRASGADAGAGAARPAPRRESWREMQKRQQEERRRKGR